MAKWGEGDPRWIVEERPDATNVNNWHWTEKDATDWSKVKLKSLFEGITFNIPDFGTATVDELSKCEGEATANNRKGKLIFFYEWVLELKWIAILDSDPEMEIKGKIDIPNLSEENEPHEVSISVFTTIGGNDGDRFKEHIRCKEGKTLQEKFAAYRLSLREEYASDLLLPTKDQGETKSKSVLSQEFLNNVRNIKMTSQLEESPVSKGPITTCELLLSHGFKCTAEDFYHTLTSREMLMAFTRSEVKLNKAEAGGSFELFSGNIKGEFVSLKPFEKIVEKWRFKTWPEGHFSWVFIDIKEEDGETHMNLKQTGIPVNDFERTKQGWNTHYFESIKRTFGFGANLM